MAPVLGLGELAVHPHLQARSALVQGPGGALQPAPAPRLSRSPGVAAKSAPREGEHTRELLSSLGLGDAQIDQLAKEGAIAFAD
ncbi:MAG: CoA transferase [Polyangiaceae bacterium]|nr:CoA transferase [Polyangiaceae bacterium]